MRDWLDLFGFFTCGAMLLLTLLGLGVAVIMPGMDRWNKRFFTAFFSVLTLCVSIYFVDEIVYRYPDMASVDKAATALGYLSTLALLPMLTVYILHCCGENWRSSAVFRAVLALGISLIILLGIAQFTTCFYYITPDNRFSRGPLHPLLVAPGGIIMLINLAIVLRWRKRLSGRYYSAFLIFTVPLTAAIIVHSFLYVPVFIDISISICAFVMFGIILTDEVEHHMRQQREIAHQRASIMVLQMRPHFIYNTMTSIYYLCDQDPEKAKQVTLDFTTYLRKNFTAIASEETIPFSEELEHTRAYLAVEQSQFEDLLFVEYDTPHIHFRVPPLTLQPIVENAVKHGMDPDSEPLRVTIRTRETDSGSEIIVEDNGPGFDPADDDEPHIALANIRNRLEMMCRGKLIITSRDGGGTVVKVAIPG